MFKYLLNFSYKRSFIQALGFYITYCMIIVLTSYVLTFVLTTILDKNHVDSHYFLVIVSTLASLLLSSLVIKHKNLSKNVVGIIAFIMAGGLAYVGGYILGLLPVAFLSAMKPVKTRSPKWITTLLAICIPISFILITWCWPIQCGFYDTVKGIIGDGYCMYGDLLLKNIKNGHFFLPF